MGLIAERRNDILEYSRNSQTINTQYQPTTVDYVAGAFGTVLMQGVSVWAAQNNDGAGGNDGKISKKTQKEIDAKQKEIDQICEENGVKNLTELRQKNTNIGNEIKTLTDGITTLNTDCEKFNTDIGLLNVDLQDKRALLESCTDETKKASINKEIGNLEAQIEDLETKLKEKQAELETKQQDLKAKQLEQASLQTGIGRVENLQNEILQLKGEEISKEVTYDVTKESADIKTFMTALKAFKADPNKETAQALKDACEKGDTKNGKDGVQQASVQKAYELVKTQVDALLAA